MLFEKGKTYEIDGVKRLVIGFDKNDPITTTDLNYEEKTADTSAGTNVQFFAVAEQLAATQKENARLAEQLAAAQKENSGLELCKKLLAAVPLDKCNKEQLATFADVMGARLTDEMDKDQMIQAVKNLT